MSIAIHQTKMKYKDSLQAALNYWMNLVPFPQPLTVAERFQSNASLDTLQSGLGALHHLVTAIYLAGVETPEILTPTTSPGIPSRLTEADFSAYPRLLFALGLYGRSIESSDSTTLEMDSHELANFCIRARIKHYEPFFTVLEKFGLVYLPSQPLQFGFPANPHLLPALALFASACRTLTNKDTNPPAEFLRVDMRVLQINRKKVRQVPLDPEEAIRCLDNDREAAFIRDLDAWARSAGYVAHVKCTGVHKSEFNAIYRQTKPGRTLFGFRTESGHVHMHVNFNQTERIIPHISRMPRAFRDLYYQRCTCAECGACKDGPLQITLDSAPRRLCRFSYMNLPEVPAEHYETIQSLLKVQDGILKGTI